MVGGCGGRGLGSLVAEEGESALGTPVREVAVLAALQSMGEGREGQFGQTRVPVARGGHRPDILSEVHESKISVYLKQPCTGWENAKPVVNDNNPFLCRQRGTGS